MKLNSSKSKKELSNAPLNFASNRYISNIKSRYQSSQQVYNVKAIRKNSNKKLDTYKQSNDISKR